MSLMTGLFHPDHYLYMRMARASFDEHFNREEYELAREYGLLCLSSYRKYKVSGTGNVLGMMFS